MITMSDHDEPTLRCARGKRDLLKQRRRVRRGRPIITRTHLCHSCPLDMCVCVRVCVCVCARARVTGAARAAIHSTSPAAAAAHLEPELKRTPTATRTGW